MNVTRKLDIEAEAAKVLIENLKAIGESDDDQLVADTLEGESNFMEVADAALERLNDLDCLTGILKDRIDAMRARADRFKKQADAIRTALGHAMSMAEIKKLERPTATISLRAVPPSAVVLDESKIPFEFWVRQDPKLDKRALLSALKEGAVEGATLSNGGSSVTIRSK